MSATVLSALIENASSEDLDELAVVLAPRLRALVLGADSLLTPKDAAARLGVHPKTVTTWAREGRLHAVRVGTGWRFDPSRLDVLPTEGKEPPPPPRQRRRQPPAASRASSATAAIRGH